MDSRITPAEAALLMPHLAPARSSEREEISLLLAEARREHDRRLGDRIAGLFGALARAIHAIRTRRETIEELRELSDRTLTDIGVARGNISDVAARAVPEAANDAAGTRRAA